MPAHRDGGNDKDRNHRLDAAGIFVHSGPDVSLQRDQQGPGNEIVDANRVKSPRPHSRIANS